MAISRTLWYDVAIWYSRSIAIAFVRTRSSGCTSPSRMESSGFTRSIAPRNARPRPMRPPRRPRRREHGEHHAERDHLRVDDLYPRPPIGQELCRLAGVVVGRGELGRQVQGDDLVGLLEQRLVDLKEFAHGGRGGGGQDAPVGHLVVEEVVIYVDALPEHLVAEDHAEGDDRDAEVMGKLLGQVGGAVGDDPNGQVALLFRQYISRRRPVEPAVVPQGV